MTAKYEEGQSGNPSFGQARELLDWANQATDDPRRTRIDLLQVANYLAGIARQSTVMRDLITDVGDALGRQVVTDKTLANAVSTGRGCPRIDALSVATEDEKDWPHGHVVPPSASYLFAGLRLIAHGTLRRCSTVDGFEALLGDPDRLAATVRPAIDSLGPDWAATLTLAAADMATEAESRSRLIAAAKDVQQLLTSGELPTLDDFSEGSTGSKWPPLRLGICPIMGGAFREDPDDDWDVNAGVITAMTACVAGFAATGNSSLIWACLLGIVAIVALLALLAA